MKLGCSCQAACWDLQLLTPALPAATLLAAGPVGRRPSLCPVKRSTLSPCGRVVTAMRDQLGLGQIPLFLLSPPMMQGCAWCSFNSLGQALKARCGKREHQPCAVGRAMSLCRYSLEQRGGPLTKQ